MELNYIDEDVIKKISSYSEIDDSYWSFKGRSKRHHCHALIQYPAMMVPQMQGVLIDSILSVDENVSTIFDPFVGSGTILGEAMTRGLNFTGYDINPLAILACEIKKGPFYLTALTKKVADLFFRLDKDKSKAKDVCFEGIDKWFENSVQIDLNRIRRAIQLEKSKWARKIFWLAFSSTIRLTCNSRSSTYKLHVKSEEQKEKIPCPKLTFRKIISKNIQSIKEQKELLNKKNYLNKSSYKGVVSICNVDTKNGRKRKGKYDLLISSPPYGDNATTVTYGQFSYLSLMWLDLNDITEKINSSLLDKKNTIDSCSLGGSLRDSKMKRELLSEISPSFELCARKIKKLCPENVKKLASFTFDLDLSMASSLEELRDNAYMVWTLGNRRISNVEVPLDKILREILESKDCKYVYQLERTIHSKKMPSRNKVASTMGTESVLIMRK